MHNRNLILGLCAMAMFLAIGSTAWAQCSDCDASATAGEYATIAQPICIEKTADLRFGGILAGTVSGTCTISGSSGTRTFQTGTGKPKGYSQITFGPAQFTVTGEPNLFYNITWYADPNNLSRTGGGGTMSCDLTAPVGGNNMNAAGTTSKLTSGGTDTWKMGGVLTIGANQAPGQYTGQFTAAVQYQ